MLMEVAGTIIKRVDAGDFFSSNCAANQKIKCKCKNHHCKRQGDHYFDQGETTLRTQALPYRK
jgi:hypothetical protein